MSHIQFRKLIKKYAEVFNLIFAFAFPLFLKRLHCVLLTERKMFETKGMKNIRNRMKVLRKLVSVLLWYSLFHLHRHLYHTPSSLQHTPTPSIVHPPCRLPAPSRISKQLHSLSSEIEKSLARIVYGCK